MPMSPSAPSEATEALHRKVSEATQVLRRAESLVEGDRRDDYGPAEKSFESLAVIWSTLLGLDKPLSGTQVALCLAALKLWRCSTQPLSMDSWCDLAGYAGLGWLCAVSDARVPTRLTSRQAMGDPNA